MKDGYHQFLGHLDLVLGMLNQFSPEYKSITEVLGENHIEYDKDYCWIIADKLDNDGYTTTSRDSVGIDIKITSSGIDFIHTGGYVGHFKKQDEKESLEIDLIKTTIDSNKVNIRLQKWNIGFAILNIILFVINIVIAYFALSKTDYRLTT